MKMQSVIFRIVTVCGGALLLAFLFKDADVQLIASLLSQIGFFALPIVLVYFIGSVFDTIAWKNLLISGSSSISFSKLLQIHIAGESFYRFIPAGAIVGEGVKALLLKKHSSFSVPEIFSSLLLRKFFMGFAQAFYIAAAVLLGILYSNAGSFGNLGIAGSVLSVVLLLLFIVMGMFLWKGSLCLFLFSLLSKIPIEKIQNSIFKYKNSFTQTDELLKQSFSKNRTKSAKAFLFFFLGWSSELVETYLILLALGAMLPITSAMLFEPVVSLLRSLVFFIPGGLGVMDAGYVSSFQLFGIKEAAAVGAAFVIVKRMKEIFWIIIGVGLTAVLGGNIFEKSFGNVRFSATDNPKVAGEIL